MKPEEHENHERWLISYADFITLLFAFFVVMYSVSSVNEGKYRVLSDALVAAFRSSAKSLSPIQVGQAVRSPYSAKLEFRRAPSAVKIPNMPAPASGKDSRAAREIRRITRQIEETMAHLIDKKLEGYTDNWPIKTEIYPSNWELSAGRAANVVHLLAREHVDPARLAAVGYGQFRPVASNATPEGRRENRRVLMIIEASAEASEDLAPELNVAEGAPRKQGGGEVSRPGSTTAGRVSGEAAKNARSASGEPIDVTGHESIEQGVFPVIDLPPVLTVPLRRSN